jgi:hypothetical protein
MSDFGVVYNVYCLVLSKKVRLGAWNRSEQSKVLKTLQADLGGLLDKLSNEPS